MTAEYDVIFSNFQIPGGGQVPPAPPCGTPMVVRANALKPVCPHGLFKSNTYTRTRLVYNQIYDAMYKIKPFNFFVLNSPYNVLLHGESNLGHCGFYSNLGR